MAARVRKPRLSVQIEQADADSIAAAAKRFSWKSESEIIRAALRLGLAQLWEDPTPLGPPPFEPKRKKRS